MKARIVIASLLLAMLLSALILPAAAQGTVDAAANRVDTPYYFEDFEADNGGYVSVGSYPWTWGPPPAGLGPPHSGIHAWATESPYHTNAGYDLHSPWIDLTGAEPTRNLVLDWWQKLDISPRYDFAYVDISTDGSNWQTVWMGSIHGVWQNVVADLSAYIGQTVMLRFHLVTDYGGVYNGWAIDDVSIYSGDRLFPGIVVTAPPLDVTLCPDQQQTLEVQICNQGAGALDWTLTELAASRGVSIPRFTGQIPPDRNPPSVERVPGQAAPAAPASRVLGQKAYAWELFSAHLYEIPDLDAPGAWNLVGGVVVTTYGGAFKGTDYSQQYVIGNNAQQLWTVNTTTGAATLIGPCVPSPSYQMWTGMSWDTTTDTMYASATDGSQSTLYTLNLETGAATKVANIANAPLNIDIAIDSAGQMYGHDIGVDKLLRIDKYTGATTFIGPTGFNANWAQGMDFDDSTGALYLAAYGDAAGAELRIADTNTGATVLVGAFPEGEVDALAIMGEMPDIAWLSEDPVSGSVPPAGCSTVGVSFDSTGLAPGGYNASLIVNSDDPHEPRIELPVSLTVEACGENVMHINKMKMNWRFAVPPYVKVIALVRVYDQDGQPVVGAEVSGDWTYPDGSVVPGTAVLLTDALGRTKFRVKGMEAGEYQFCVTGMELAGYTYDPGANDVPPCMTINVGP